MVLFLQAIVLDGGTGTTPVLMGVGVGAVLLIGLVVALLRLGRRVQPGPVLKWAGAAYLVYLGVQALRAPRAAAAAAAPHVPPWRRVLRDGFWVALLNPKTTLFFAAFLPQFINPHGSALAQSAALGVVFVLIAACTDTAYVLLANRVAPALGRVPRGAAIGRYAQAAVYFGLGALAATAGQRPVR